MNNIHDPLMACSRCHEQVPSSTTATCLTAHIELLEYDLDPNLECAEDLFYCESCVNALGFCLDCEKKIPADLQKVMFTKYNG